MTSPVAYVIWCFAIGLTVAAGAYLIGRWRRGDSDVRRDAAVILAGGLLSLAVMVALYAGGVLGTIVVGIAALGTGSWLWRDAAAEPTWWATPGSRLWGRRAGVFLALAGGSILIGLPLTYIAMHVGR